MSQGVLVFSPISHTHGIACHGGLPTDWRFWERYDRAMLAACSRLLVLRLDGWDRSVGVAAEIRIARETGTEVLYIDSEADWADEPDEMPDLPPRPPLARHDVVGDPAALEAIEAACEAHRRRGGTVNRAVVGHDLGHLWTCECGYAFGPGYARCRKCGRPRPGSVSAMLKKDSDQT